jgi:cyclophilin family peptidyl-prolyl cis-trans isomerase
MGTSKRERQKEARLQRLEQERASYQQATKRQRLIAAGLAGLVLFGVLALVLTRGGDDDADLASDTSSTTQTTAETTTSSTEVPPSSETTAPPEETTTTAAPEETTTTTAATTEEPTGFTYGTGKCPGPDAKRKTAFDDAPKKCIDTGKDYGAVIDTSKGKLTIDLAEGAAPGTVNNFVVLSRWHFYDGDDFHRIIPGFVAQGGDPVGDPPGTGGPGYAIPDELPGSLSDYKVGTIAMANSGPDSGGSQFFLVLKEGTLDGPKYAIFGQVTEGNDVLTAIEAEGSSTGEPKSKVEIRSITITEK